ncbi:hypothetical protein C8R44DRAFT_798896 [Mycena epipterygia]|nr:hypothetical protein C8R44DRAFT_798896 [Mycena epipterygia]
MPDGNLRPHSTEEFVANLNLLPHRTLDVESIHRLLSKFIEGIEECPVDLFQPNKIIEALVPCFAPPNTRYGDPVAEGYTRLAGSAVTALSSIVRRYGATPLWPETWRALLAHWPATCMGLVIYLRALLRDVPVAILDAVDSPAYTFTAIVSLLLLYTPVDSLAALVRNTREATVLIIKLWALQVMHPTLSEQLKEMLPGVYPPTAAGLLNRHVFADRDPETYGALLISALGGTFGHAGIASIGLEHIRRATSALSQQEQLPVGPVADNMLSNLLNLNCLHSTPLQFLLVSQNSVCVTTEALIALTSRPFDAVSADAVADCIVLICEYLHQCIGSDGLTFVNQSLERGLLVGLLKAHPWLAHKPAAYAACIALLTTHLPKYLIYISVLRHAHKSLDVIQQLGLVAALSDSYRTVWLAFEKYARIRLGLANDAELASLSCNGVSCLHFCR